MDARNLKFILCLFEQMSGLKINFRKSEIFCLGEAADKESCYADIFTCPYNCLPMKYLGVPIDDKKLCKSLWLPTVEKVEKNGKEILSKNKPLFEFWQSLGYRHQQETKLKSERTESY